eukprot:CAMPEP_0117579762 /NCGR_PEP_ID=MMETSP0784-20121206/64802_1 /TAXON_ID=39447 /ORGANISM="" /LENGTH=498 /DNA_ID=CAMNT_0005379699 /DNA_START=1 /DNA_END=1497 /DNA_ORIENTATION=-
MGGKPSKPNGDQDSSGGSTTCKSTSKEESTGTNAPVADEPFSFEALEAAIEELRRDPPKYVSSVGRLSVPSMVLNDDGVMVKPSGGGPWIIEMSVQGSDENEAYNFPFRVAMRFDRKWPTHAPRVRFRGVFHHALVDDSGGMVMPFYKMLPRDGTGVYTVRIVVEAVHSFLVNPLDAWKISAPPTALKNTMRVNSEQNSQRLKTIRKYREMVRHPELFESPPCWKAEWFEPDFWRAQKEGTEEAWRSILTEHLPGEVFSFKLFTDSFCDLLLEEIFNFYASALPARRPNSMNNYGIILNEIGLEPMIDELQKLLQPLGEILWPGPGSVWDGHHCFIVRYREGEDLGLDMHTDDSDVTFNVCLGLEFIGAGLQFCGHMGAPNHRKHTYTFHHIKGTVVCHLGRKRHGADDITSGERLNLILWNHSSSYRGSEDFESPTYEREEGVPDQVCLSYTHDRDYGNFKEYPKGKEDSKGRGWCPPTAFAYEGFKPDSENEKGRG